MEVLSDGEFRSHILELGNAVQESNDGMFLESLLCSTVCLASHSNGIGGIGLKQFLSNLVYQLQIGRLDSNQITISGLEQFDQSPFHDFTIPFLSPANQNWPDIPIPGSNFALLERARNEDKIDLSSSCGLYGESKDYGSEIQIEKMRHILKRVPENATVELVFTRKLQNSYFNRQAQSFENEFRHSHLLKKAFYKIDASKPETVLKPVKGLPTADHYSTGVVIFFEINGVISHRH